MKRAKLIEEQMEKVDAITHATSQALEILAFNAQTLRECIEETRNGVEEFPYALDTNTVCTNSEDDDNDPLKFKNPVK